MPILYPMSARENAKFVLPSNMSELNSVVCGNLSREVKGPSCGRCTNRTDPSFSLWMVLSVAVQHSNDFK